MASASTYLATWRRRVANRIRTLGAPRVLAGAFLPLAVAAALLPLLSPVFLAFLAGPVEGWAEGIGQVLFRAALLVVGWVALDLYGAVVRGEERAVLAGWPVEPSAVVAYLVVKSAAERWWLVPALAILLAPIAIAGAAGAYTASILVLLGAFGLAHTAGAAVLLGAIAAAEDPRIAPLLDLLRGNNPRAQAAFLYAPGLVLGLVGLVLSQAAFSVGAAASGDALAIAWVVAPLLLAPVGWLPVPRLARERWFDGTAVLAEIDARYAALEEPEEALRVYLDGLARFLPAKVRVYALRDLRHGWRARRTLITGAWLVGVVGLVAAWTASPDGPTRAALVAVAGCLLVGSVGAALSEDEPEFLRRVLPDGGGARHLARAWVVVLWVQPCVWFGAVGVTVRRGLGEAAAVVGIGVAATCVAAALAVLSTVRPSHSRVIYAPTAALVGGAMAAWISGGLV